MKGIEVSAASLTQDEIRRGKRFAFGDNWREFLVSIDEERITRAEDSLREMLGTSDLRGKTFLDAGSGSGLFSLAARRMGAIVHSFDIDPSSVMCTQETRRRYFPDDASWTVEEGSILEPTFLTNLRPFDVVYSWGVLHHTGAMWRALSNIALLVRPGGKLCIAIYNDQGRWSRLWTGIKRLYCHLPKLLKPLVSYPALLWIWGPGFLRDMLMLRPFHTWRTYKRDRGMSPWRDVLDWVGGYPFEVAKPEEIFDFYTRLGFDLRFLRTVGGRMGNNQFTFIRNV